MLASGRNRPLSALGGPETRELTLSAGRLDGQTDEDGLAVQPAGDLVVHKQVQGHKVPSLQPIGSHLLDVDDPPSRSGRPERIAKLQP